jgi:hypothetical protein
MEQLKKVGTIKPKSSKDIQFSRISLGFEKLDRNVFDPEKAYDKVAECGVKKARIQSGWQRTEKEKGVYDFAWLDSVVDNLIAIGVEPWLCLCYGNDLYTEMAKVHFGAVGCVPIHSEEEKQAWQANSDLLTSMTHDIRTPLTTLLGYMELLSADSDSLTPEQKEYIRVCTAKAEQIKGLSDKLFLYFWAFNRVEPEAELESVEAGLLFEQLLADYIPAMEAEGLHIVTDLTALTPTDTLRIRAESIRRVTDNIFDNLVKYADRDYPVTVTATRGDSVLTVSFSNTVARKSDKTSSTRIGVKTCVNMMKMMNGSFVTKTEEGIFTASLSLPLSDMK